MPTTPELKRMLHEALGKLQHIENTLVPLRQDILRATEAALATRLGVAQLDEKLRSIIKSIE